MKGLDNIIKTLKLYCSFVNYDTVKRDILIQVNLDFGSGKIIGYYWITRGNCKFEQGVIDSPDITFTGHLYEFHDLVNGISTIDEIVLRGNAKIEGNSEIIAKLDKIFTRTIDPYELGYWDDKWSTPEEEWSKPESVLVINGSGRGKNGITWAFLEPFLEGIKEAGVDVEVIHIYDPDLKIEPCHGCFACQAIKVAQCILNDDANLILEKIKRSTLTIFAMPVYLFSAPAKLKALLDRMFVELQPFFIERNGWTSHPLWFRKKGYMALFAISGYPEREMFDPLNTMFEWLARESHSKLIAKINRSGAWIYKLAPQFEKYFKIISDALRKAGKQLVEEGKIDEDLIKIIEKDYIPKEVYYRINNAFWYNRYRKMGVDPRKIIDELSA